MIRPNYDSLCIKMFPISINLKFTPNRINKRKVSQTSVHKWFREIECVIVINWQWKFDEQQLSNCIYAKSIKLWILSVRPYVELINFFIQKKWLTVCEFNYFYCPDFNTNFRQSEINNFSILIKIFFKYWPYLKNTANEY